MPDSEEVIGMPGFRSAVADEMAEIIGVEAVTVLCDAFPGLPLYVPDQPTHRLVALIGSDQAALLCRHYSGCSVVMPRLTVARAQQKHRLIREDRARGLSASQLARKYGYGLRHIWNVLAGSDETDRNLSFDF